MNAPLLELEGTWEEVAARAPKPAGCKVRLVVLPEGADEAASFRPRSGRSLLQHAGTWVGDDLQDCQKAVIQSRSPIEFNVE